AAIPVAGVGLIRPPRPPQPPLAEREMAWRLIRQLSFNYLPLAVLTAKAKAVYGKHAFDVRFFIIQVVMSDLIQHFLRTFLRSARG
ncbi:type VI secretion system baseplate subunit TssF, partial [Salmonella enterica subsp. enterica serovar Cerro]|nr:type VI secretion system baseplate subunit TssF [Salmonella enterica subsp. enterica serovar Cerro]